MAAIGEAAALEEIPKIRRLLSRLDPQLFPVDEKVSGVNGTVDNVSDRPGANLRLTVGGDCL
jgi:hypothetical protein